MAQLALFQDRRQECVLESVMFAESDERKVDAESTYEHGFRHVLCKSLIKCNTIWICNIKDSMFNICPVPFLPQALRNHSL